MSYSKTPGTVTSEALERLRRAFLEKGPAALGDPEPTVGVEGAQGVDPPKGEPTLDTAADPRAPDEEQGELSAHKAREEMLKVVEVQRRLREVEKMLLLQQHIDSLTPEKRAEFFRDTYEAMVRNGTAVPPDALAEENARLRQAIQAQVEELKQVRDMLSPARSLARVARTLPDVPEGDLGAVAFQVKELLSALAHRAPEVAFWAGQALGQEPPLRQEAIRRVLRDTLGVAQATAPPEGEDTPRGYVSLAEDANTTEVGMDRLVHRMVAAPVVIAPEDLETLLLACAVHTQDAEEFVRWLRCALTPVAALMEGGSEHPSRAGTLIPEEFCLVPLPPGYGATGMLPFARRPEFSRDVALLRGASLPEPTLQDATAGDGVCRDWMLVRNARKVVPALLAAMHAEEDLPFVRENLYLSPPVGADKLPAFLEQTGTGRLATQWRLNTGTVADSFALSVIEGTPPDRVADLHRGLLRGVVPEGWLRALVATGMHPEAVVYAPSVPGAYKKRSPASSTARAAKKANGEVSEAVLRAASTQARKLLHTAILAATPAKERARVGVWLGSPLVSALVSGATGILLDLALQSASETEDGLPAHKSEELRDTAIVLARELRVQAIAELGLTLTDSLLSPLRNMLVGMTSDEVATEPDPLPVPELNAPARVVDAELAKEKEKVG